MQLKGNPPPSSSSAWRLEVLDVLRRTPLNRPLGPGEVALIAFEFTVPPYAAVRASPTIQIEGGDDDDVTLDSPHILAVDENIYWGDNYQNCITDDNM
uniref:PKD_channel domain-containing protein n=1 Tax=Mesocestoides corti TaxID=53468 RepID=A0A5K3FPA3_MESCO